MPGHCWQSNACYGEGIHRKAHAAGNADGGHCRKPEHLRPSASVRAGEADRIRPGGRRANDIPWGSAGQIIGDYLVNIERSRLRYRVSMAFAIATVLAAWFGVIGFLFHHVFH